MIEKPADNKVQLGCGTLIIIAIIVMMFSGADDSSKLKNEVEQLNEKIDRLEKKIDDLSNRLPQSAPAAARSATPAATTTPSS